MPPPGHEVQAEWPGSLEANRSVWSKTVLYSVRSEEEIPDKTRYDAERVRPTCNAPRVNQREPTQ